MRLSLNHPFNPCCSDIQGLSFTRHKRLQQIQFNCSNEQEGSYLQSLLILMYLPVASSCSVYCSFSLCHIWGSFILCAKYDFGKSKIIKQAFKCNILAENVHVQLNVLPQQHIYEPKINIHWSTVMSLNLKHIFHLPFYSHFFYSFCFCNDSKLWQTSQTSSQR